uniref:UDP-glycosyltransferases domain-containing protein n=1 Tax=Stomoxys calcitrans TaxID=35570 RepID=A0A1I8PI82_STOCA
MIIFKILLILGISWQIAITDGANILGIFTSHSPSHLIVHLSVANVLAERGHNITVVASSQPKIAIHKNITMIVVPLTKEQEVIMHRSMEKMASNNDGFLTLIRNFFGSLKIFIDAQADILKDPRFTKLYESEDTKYDLVMCGFFMNTFQLGVAAKFKAPLIVTWTSAAMSMVGRMVGNPSGVEYVPSHTVNMDKGQVKMNFLQRLKNFLSYTVFDILTFIMDIRMKQIYNDIFQDEDDSFPTLDEMYKNVSLVFCNSHFSEASIKAQVPAVVEIGGIQVKEKPNRLPENLETFIENSSEHGFILFSLGTNVKGSHVKSEIAKRIFNVLSKLKQNIIWKWDDLKHTPGNSSNILYTKWLPQDDILAHPYLKLFITHAGKGGIAEAQYHGVPMLAIPIFGDQHPNALHMVQAGYGLMVNYFTLSEEVLSSSLQEVLHNPIYRENVQRFSRLYRDRPLSARENVAYWTEYVMRHRGATHMQSPLVHMNFIESSNLDVYVVILLILYIMIVICRCGFLFVKRKVCDKKCKKNSKIKNKMN